MTTTPSGPLAGVRVLDLTRVLSGPYCSMLLGDAGADVIKIERPGVGDDTRHWGPPFTGGESVYFLTINRNKRSVAIDLTTEAGQRLVRRMAAEVDVVLENFRPGTMDDWGLGYDVLSADHPGLIYVSISGYGREGPRRDDPGYDAFVMALGGMMSITGEAGGDPVRPGVALLDMATGLGAHAAISSALYARTRDGRGQRIDLSLFGTQIGLLVNIATNHLVAGLVAERMGAEHPSIVPYNTYRTLDGHVMVGALNDTFWRRLCTALDLADLAADPRLATNPGRVAHRDLVNREIAERLVGLTTADAVAILADADVTAAPINDVAAALADPQVAALGLLTTMTHPTAGEVPVVGPTVAYGGTPTSVHLPAPLLGEHTDDILGDLLGLTPSEIADLRDEGAIA